MSSALRPATWLILAALISATALAFVHALEANGYIPCELCLRQRVVYWTGIAIAAAGLLLGRLAPVWTRVAVVAVGAAFLAGAGLAAYHAGVEWKWWPGPTTCTGTNAKVAVGAAQVADIFSSKTRLHMVRCDEAAIRFGGLSLSGWNALGSAALAIISLAVAARAARRPA